jgi:hypothetical protein
MLLAALRRLALLFLGSAAGVAAVSALLGVLFGASVARSVSIGFYIAGSFLLVAGFFVGNRGPLRMQREDAAFTWSRSLRRATPEEREEAINMSAVFVALGLGLIFLGVAADSRYRLI